MASLPTISELCILANAGSLVLSQDTIGELAYNLLSEIFKQEDFILNESLEPCEVNVSNNTLIIKCSINDLLPFGLVENITIFIFDLTDGVSDERHVLLKVPIPNEFDLENYLYAYRDGQSNDSIEEFQGEIAISTFSAEPSSDPESLDLNAMGFNSGTSDPSLLFSSLDYSADQYINAIYPSEFDLIYAKEKVRQGINFIVKLVLDGNVERIFKDVLGENFEGVLNFEYGGLINMIDSEPYFSFDWPINTSKTIAPLTFDLERINIAFPLVSPPKDHIEGLPVISTFGSVTIDSNEFSIILTFDLYENTLNLSLKVSHLTLGEFIAQIGIDDYLSNYFDDMTGLLAVYLSDAKIVINYEDLSIEKIGINFKTETPVSIIPGVIELAPEVDMVILYPFDTERYAVSGQLLGRWQIADVGLTTSLDYPDMDVLISLDEGDTFDVPISYMFPDGFEFLDYSILKLQLAGNLKEKTFSFNVYAKQEVGGGFKLGKLSVDLTEIILDVDYEDGEVSNISLSAILIISSATLNISAAYNTDVGLQLAANSAPEDIINISYIFNNILEFVSLDIPGIPSDFDLYNIQMSAVPDDGEYSFNCKADLAIVPELNIKIEDFSISRYLENTELIEEGVLEANIVLAGVTIYLGAKITNRPEGSESYFSGGTKGLNLDIKLVLNDLLKEIFNYRDIIPTSFIPDVLIDDIFISYDGAKKQTNLIALASIDGIETTIFFQNQSKVIAVPANGIEEIESHFVLGILSNPGSFESLPVVGEELKDVYLEDFGFIYTSKAGEYEIPILVGGDIKSIQFADAKNFEEGLNLSAKLILSADLDPIDLFLPIVPDSVESLETADTSEPVESNETESSAPDYSESILWITIEKKLGPVSLQRVGFAYESGTVVLYLSGDATLNGLTLRLEGLNLAVELGTYEMKPGLVGLGLEYTKAPVEVGAMMLRSTKNGVDSFDGTAYFKTADFNVAGLGSYTTIDGDPSLFVYALYNKPIGGPSFFFVTGLAAGFGYNRKVRIPNIEEIQDFPLVSMALSEDVNSSLPATLNKLIDGEWIVPSLGDYWLAVGVKFTSFKIVESFLLLIVEFGNSLEFNILGLSVLRWPSDVKLEAIAYVELAMKATFGPDSDVIAIQAMLTDNSYIFDKSAELRGGFAFYSWISGEHEGDFVLTLGGYHPNFKKPDHYPTVDRLSLNWKLPAYPVTIKGEMYYALTPTAIMAGGKWEVTYDLGFLKAYLVVWADMLIQWAPFHYELSAGIRVGVKASIKVLFVYINFKVEIGAQMKVSGPPFAGEVYVDWSIFSFTIPFGDHSGSKRDKIEWDEFSKSFLPLNSNKDKVEPISISIADGIIEEPKDTNGNVLYTIVNPHKLNIKVDSAVPVSEITGVEGLAANSIKTSNGNDDLYYADRQSAASLGIRPMKKTSLGSILNLDIKLNGSTSISMNPTCMAKSYPTALWSSTESSGIDSTDSAVIQNVLCGILFSPFHADIPVEPPGFDLNGKYEEVSSAITWTNKTILNGPSNESLKADAPIEEIIKDSLDDPNVESEWNEICLAAALIQGIDEEEVGIELSHEWVDKLTAEPVIVQIGGRPQYQKETGTLV